MARRLRIGVLFGGRSGEHAVSLMSAQSIIGALNPQKYDVVPIGITTEGRWLVGGDPMAVLRGETALEATATQGATLVADPTFSKLVTNRVKKKQIEYQSTKINKNTKKTPIKP